MYELKEYLQAINESKKPLLDLNNDLDDYLINGNNRDEESHILTL